MPLLFLRTFKVSSCGGHCTGARHAHARQPPGEGVWSWAPHPVGAAHAPSRRLGCGSLLRVCHAHLRGYGQEGNITGMSIALRCYHPQVSLAPPYAVDDANFKKLVAILRIAVPYTGMILRCAGEGATTVLTSVPLARWLLGCSGCCSLRTIRSSCPAMRVAAPGSRQRCGGSCCAWA